MIASDFADNSLTGIATVIGGFASITKTLTNDIFSEGPESFQVIIRSGSPSGSIVGTSPVITIGDTSIPTYTITPSTTSVNEGSTVTFNISTLGVNNGTTIYYDITGSTGISSSDFTSNSLSGSLVISGTFNSGSATTSLTLINDVTTEGTETFNMNVRTGSISGRIVGTSPTISINDTSLTPTLYSFTSATFSPGGQTGRTGPTLATAISGLTGTGVDSWKNNTAFFDVSSGVQIWTVPATGTYSIECFGAQGANDTRITVAGGLGAVIKGNFILTKGDKYSIVVGQQGTTQSNGWGGGGGGGGTFVWKTGVTTQPVIVAGGGGCGGQSSIGSQAGQITTSGADGSNSGGTGGTNGAASQSQNICGGGGGRGWLGGASYNCGGSFTYSATYVDATGYTTNNGGDGGFGGGGGSYGGGGGGGGYSGGGAGGWPNSGCGGGGGSYNTGTTQTNTAGARSGPGQVIITLL